MNTENIANTTPVNTLVNTKVEKKIGYIFKFDMTSDDYSSLLTLINNSHFSPQYKVDVATNNLVVIMTKKPKKQAPVECSFVFPFNHKTRAGLKCTNHAHDNGMCKIHNAIKKVVTKCCFQYPENYKNIKFRGQQCNNPSKHTDNMCGLHSAFKKVPVKKVITQVTTTVENNKVEPQVETQVKPQVETQAKPKVETQVETQVKPQVETLVETLCNIIFQSIILVEKS